MSSGALIIRALALVAAACAVARGRTPIWSLDASTLASAADNWTDVASASVFKPVGTPRLVSYPGAAGRSIPAVAFDVLSNTAYVAVWAYQFSSKDTELRVENTLVSWGRRGQAYKEVAFNFGSHPTFGAVVHYGADIGWCQNPLQPLTWRHLVYTYDGAVAKVYANGMFNNELNVGLDTDCTTSFLLGAQNNEAGNPDFNNPNNPLSSVAISKATVWEGAFSAAEVAALFADESKTYAPSQMDTGSVEIDAGVLHDVGNMTIGISPATGTLTRLSPKGDSFDFSVGVNKLRCMSGRIYHYGDVTMRIGAGGGNFWTSRTAPMAATVLAPGKRVVSAVDISSTFGQGFPLKVTRRWMKNCEGSLVLRFTLKNPGTTSVVVSGFGVAIPSNNDWTGRSLEDAHATCSITDPYVGAEAGWVQIVRLNGRGSAIVVLPERGTTFEAWRPLADYVVPRGVTFEGIYEWVVHSAGWAASDWKSTGTLWNKPTQVTLAPGKSVTYGFVFALAPSVAEVEPTVRKYGVPVAMALPGTILAADQTSKLVLMSDSPVSSVTVSPAGAVDLQLVSSDMVASGVGLRTVYNVVPKALGFSRVSINYAGSCKRAGHTVNYYATPSQRDAVDKVASHHETKQWYTDTSDPFNRTWAFLPWSKNTNSMVTEEYRSYIAGLSDEAGAGPNLLMAMKSLRRPTVSQVLQLDKYATQRLYGGLQGLDGSIKASMFYYDTTRCPGCYKTVTSGWGYDQCMSTWRTYNYPHQVAVYWSLYRIARLYQPLAAQLAHSWDWYLNKAVFTIVGMKAHGNRFIEWGLMDGSVFLEVLRDCKRENRTDLANTIEGVMNPRIATWSGRSYPFGSEMPWDSTGQEEVYQWMAYRGLEEKRLVTLDVVRAYTPLVAHWGWSGSARRYFDDVYYGLLPGVARGFHHYGASLNSIVLLDSFRRDPDSPTSLQLIRAGYAAANGVLGNIDKDGFAAMHFFSDPAYNTWEPYNGDYGSAFFGYVYSAGAYVVNSVAPLTATGRLCFGCEFVAAPSAGSECVVPKDAFHQRVFVSHLRMWVTLEAGEIEMLCYPVSASLPAVAQLTLAPRQQGVLTSALIRMGDGATIDSEAFTVGAPATRLLGGWSVELGANSTVVAITKSN
eukprot:m51a1_g6657 hypothetical protein (1131) ;mRNA; r:149604-153148